MPVKAAPIAPFVYNWTGVYVGGHAGYGIGMKDWDLAGSNFDYEAKGFLGGGQTGVNQQIGNWVIGIEADASWADIKGSQTVFTGGANLARTVAATTTIDWLVTVAGRLGFAQDRWLVYVKAGGAWAHENHSLGITANLPFAGAILTGSTAATGAETRFGPLLGFGAEYALWGNWSFKSEYNYLQLWPGTARLVGTQTLLVGVSPPGPFTTDASIRQAFHLLKLGLNYRFGPDAPSAIAPAPPTPGYNWTGFYAGVQAAYGFGRKEWEVGPEGRFDVSGALAGGVTGTNVQAGVFVFGAESEWMWSGVKGSTRFARPFGTTGTQTFDFATSMDWLSLSSVRAGFVAADRWLVYAKGGVALAHEAHAQALQGSALGLGNVTRSANGTALHTGYLAGVGVEYAFLGNWSAKLEYNYIDFRPQTVIGIGSQVVTNGPFGSTSATAQRDTIDQNMHLVKFGVNYKFSTGLADIVTAKF
ncbi:MAG: outer membrane beta-barrel protein [Xanthobacteraceae bacterium]